MRQKFREGRYPYLSARIRVRKAKLLKGSDYEKMLKMDIHTLIKFLEDRGFAFEGVSEKNPFEIVEAGINAHLESEFSALSKIAQGSAKIAFLLYLKRYDLENVKILLRMKRLGEFDANVFICAGSLKRSAIEKLRHCEVREILSSLRLLTEKEINELAKLYEEENFVDLENFLDKKYLFAVAKATRNLKREGAWIKKFVRMRIDVINLRKLYSLKKAGAKREEIIPLLLPFGTIPRKELEELAGMELEEMHAKISRRFPELAETEVRRDLGEIDARLEVNLLKTAEKLMHAHPLSLAPLMAYVLMKEAEARNIKLIARAKYHGVEEEEIRKNLVILE